MMVNEIIPDNPLQFFFFLPSRFIMSEVDKVSGLRTVDALQLLHTELVKVVDDHTETLKKVQWRHFLSAMRGKSSCFSPFSLVCFLVMSVLLFVAAFVDSDGRYRYRPKLK